MAKPISIGVFIVDSDLERRMRLKQATVPVTLFRQTTQLSTLDEALSKLDYDDSGDLIFISSRFGEAEMSTFISRAKEMKRGQDSTFVLVLDAKEQASARLPEYMLLGIDGFLFEPYSVDGLVETANLSLRIKGERREARERLAITVMAKDIIRQIDTLSLLKRYSLTSSKVSQRLTSLGESVRKLSNDSLEVYFKVLVDEMIAAPLPEKQFQVQSYVGASSRVKKLMEKKLVEQLEKENVS